MSTREILKPFGVIIVAFGGIACATPCVDDGLHGRQHGAACQSPTSSTAGATTLEATTTGPSSTVDWGGTTIDAVPTTGSTGGGAVCGDGVLDAGEACDDGPGNGEDRACKLDCTDQVCGDGALGAGEDCDDGNLQAGDGCGPTCVPEVPGACGDGDVNLGETCDDGNLDDTDACPGTCQAATCGDGFVRAGVEACDDANLDDTDDCLGTCQDATCGDGFVHAGVESCDDANLETLDACTNDCFDNPPRLVFVSSELVAATLGGLAGADAKCQDLAAAAGLPGTYKAWLSGAGMSADARMAHYKVPYTLIDGTPIAPDYSGLIDGELDAPIFMTEKQTAPPKSPIFFCDDAEYRVFTNTHFDGADFFPTGCTEWSMTTGGASWGLADSVSKDWSSHCNSPDQGCDITALLYCFQQ